MRRVEAANRSLTVAATNLAPGFSALLASAAARLLHAGLAKLSWFAFRFGDVERAASDRFAFVAFVVVCHIAPARFILA